MAGNLFPVSHFQSQGDKIIAQRYHKQPTIEQLAGMEIPRKFSVTLRDDEDFLLSKDNYAHPPCKKYLHGRAECIIIMGSAVRFRELCDTRSIWADGTFKVCPKPFYQLYIFHRVYNTSTRPCVYVLMSRKTQFAYERLFTRLRALAAVRGHSFTMEYFHCDYEVAAMAALSVVFSNMTIIIRGCYFHLCSAMFKKAVKLGLKGHYSKPGVKIHIKMCMALAFLPHNRIAQTLEDIEASYVAMNDIPNKPNLTRFFQYVRRSWVGGRVVPINVWSFHGFGGRRTSCDVEGYHSQLNKKIQGKSDNLWSFITQLQHEEDRVHCDIATVPYGGLMHKLSKPQLQKEVSLTSYKHTFDTDPLYSALDYVRAIAKTTLKEDDPIDLVDHADVDDSAE